MTTLIKKTEVLMAAFTISLLLNAQTPNFSENGNLTSSNVKKLNATTLSNVGSKADNSKLESKAQTNFEFKLESELNSITQQISETVKFRPDCKISCENKNDYDASLIEMTEKIGESVKYQPVSIL